MFEYSSATQSLKVRMDIAHNVSKQLCIQLSSSTEALPWSMERASWLYEESSPLEDEIEVKGGGGRQNKGFSGIILIPKSASQGRFSVTSLTVGRGDMVEKAFHLKLSKEEDRPRSLPAAPCVPPPWRRVPL